MKIAAAALALASLAWTPSSAAEGPTRLAYLASFDTDAIHMLSCADLMANDKSSFYFMEKREISSGAADYKAAGRAAVVRAALEAPSSPKPPKIANLSFLSRDATAIVTSDLRAHENKAASFVRSVRASGFDVSLSCTDPETRAKAASLNEWFARDTSLLKSVK